MNRDFDKPLPSSPDTERTILGSIILDNGLMDEAAQLFNIDSGAEFYVPSHRKTFLAMVALYRIGMEINPITLKEELARESSLESVGGIMFLSSLSGGLPHVT